MKNHNFLVNYLGIWGVPLKPAYMKTLEAGVDGFKANFESAWPTLDQGQQDDFCAVYYNDVAQNVRAFSVLPSEFYALYLSPVSEEGIEQFERAVKRAEKVKWLALFAQVASLAAQVSSGHDAIKAGQSGLLAGQQGGIASMNAQMAQSRYLFNTSARFGDISQGFGSVVAAPQDREHAGLMRSGEGDVASLDCEALTHFAQWSAPSGSEVWKTYRGLATDCGALSKLRKN